MDVQGYLPHAPENAPQVLHYAQVNLTPRTQPVSFPPPSPMPGITPPVPASHEKQSSSSRYASSLPLNNSGQSGTSGLPPSSALLDKRKSSPAVLGVPLGLSEEAQAQLSLHLSQQRNSIEAAMLLANFNRLPSTTPAVAGKQQEEDQSKKQEMDVDDTNHNHSPWPAEDDMSISTASSRPRRHSYDIHMTWASMPPEFLERSEFYQDHQSSSSTSSSSSSTSTSTTTTSTPSSSSIVAGHEAAKLTWMHNGRPQEHKLIDYSRSSFPPGVPAPYPSDLQRFPPIHHPHGGIHPLASPSSSSPSDAVGTYYPYPPYSSVSTPTPMPPPPPPPPHHMPQSPGQPMLPPFYYHQQGGGSSSSSSGGGGGKLLLPGPVDGQRGEYGVNNNHGGMRVLQPRRKKTRSDPDEDDMSMALEPGHPDFPDMSLKDIEAARVDPEARPRRQKLRYEGDMYTPQWVRYNGQAKEGLCDTCQPGKWLQLKNSAFWYHKQFFHGISSVSGKEFLQPLETRWVDQDMVEGLCHQCRQWVAVSNVKRKNSVLWYRHAHKCHVYHKPKVASPKRR